LSSPTVDTLGDTTNADALSETYNSVTPYRWGDYIAKYRLMPIAPDQRALTGRTAEAGDRPDAIREDVRVEMARLDAEWEFQVQLCRDLEKQLIENPTVEWDEAISPFQRVDAVTDMSASRRFGFSGHQSTDDAFSAPCPDKNETRDDSATASQCRLCGARCRHCGQHLYDRSQAATGAT
jgi:hypothetical protein